MTDTTHNSLLLSTPGQVRDFVISRAWLFFTPTSRFPNCLGPRGHTSAPPAPQVRLLDSGNGDKSSLSSRPVPLPFHLPGFKAHGSQTSSRKTPGLGNQGFQGLRRRTPAGWDRIRLGQPGARATGERPGKGPGATVSHPENYSRSPQPGTLRPLLGSPLGGPGPSPRRVARPGRGPQPEWGRPRDGAGTRTWAFGTPAPRPSHLQPPKPARVGRCPQEAPPERGRGREAVRARASASACPWLETGREARLRALGLPGIGHSRRHKFAGPAGTCAGGRAALGRCSRLVITPAGVGRRGAARLHPGAGCAERALDVSAGALQGVSSRGPNWQRAGCGGEARSFPLGPPGELRRGEETEKGSGEWGPREAGEKISEAQICVPEENSSSRRGLAQS